MLKVVVVNPPTEEQKEQMYKALEALYEEGETKDEIQYGQSNEKFGLLNNVGSDDVRLQLHICTNDREVVQMIDCKNCVKMRGKDRLLCKHYKKYFLH